MNRPRGQARVPSFALLLLINELVRSATTYGIPIVTLVTIIGQILIFLGIIPLPSDSVWSVCLSYDAIVNQKQYLRLVLSQLCHGDDWHLYYNMVSFLWKGRSLETRLGSVRYAITLIVFIISTAFTYVFANKLMAEMSEDFSYLRHCSVGFSGVIFGLKVLTTHYDRSQVSYLMGFPIGSKYAVWAELVLIQLISPNASFVGHLAGILVGLAYIYGPIYYVIEIATNVFNQLFVSNSTSNRSQSNYSRNYRQNDYSSGSYSESTFRTNYENYIPNDMSEEEQLRRAYEQSLNDSDPNRSPRAQPRAQPTAPPYPTTAPPYPSTSPPYPGNDNFQYPSSASNQLDAEALRQLRLRRYQK